MPQPVKDATKDLLAKKIDKQTWIDRIRARTSHLFMPKQRTDSEGHRRMMCPAQAGRTQCPRKPHTLGRGIHLPLIDPEPGPVGSPPCCTQRSVTLPPEAGAQLRRPLQYGSEAWQRVCFRPRNSVEGINGHAEDALYERLEEPGIRPHPRHRGPEHPPGLPARRRQAANSRPGPTPPPSTGTAHAGGPPAARPGRWAPGLPRDTQ